MMRTSTFFEARKKYLPAIVGYFSLVVSALLVGCSTQGFKQAQNECVQYGFQQFPIRNEPTVTSTPRNVEVPTGETNCVTDYSTGQARTSCKQQTRLELRYEQSVVIVDANLYSRLAAIDSCAKALCFQRSGNYECKVEKVSQPVVQETHDPQRLKQINCRLESAKISYTLGADLRNTEAVNQKNYSECMQR